MQNSITARPVQPSILSKVESFVKNLKSNLKSKSEKMLASYWSWHNSKSETFTALCGSENDLFLHGDVVKAHLYLISVLVILLIGGSL